MFSGSGLRRSLYSIILHMLLPVACARLLWLGLRNSAYRRRWGERFGRVIWDGNDALTICIHAVSVGEVLSAGTLIPRLRRAFPGARFLVTTFTPTGADMVSTRLDEDVKHVYFPYDLPWAVTTFLERVRPRMVLVMETEIWPNFYAACRRCGIDLVMVNARISPRSLVGYRRFPHLIADTLSCVTYVAAQTRADAARFRQLGVPDERLGVFGNLKFDIHISRSVSEQGQALRRSFSTDRLVWVAASTHAGEEEIVLSAFASILRVFPNCLLVLAPRHPERFGEVAGRCRSAGLSLARRSEGTMPGIGNQVFLLDSLGELLPYYASADMAFVGGSLVPAGGHNLLEPASLGLPLLTGPHTFNFSEVMEFLEGAGAVYVVDNAEHLASKAIGLLGDPNLRHAMGEEARRVCATHRGAAERVVNLIDRLQAPRTGLPAPPVVLG